MTSFPRRAPGIPGGPRRPRPPFPGPGPVPPTPSPTPGPGTTFTLTTGSDTATANVFEGPVQIVGNFALNTLTNGDRLTGVGENPTLRVDINTGVTAANITPAALNNLNTLEVNFTALGGAGVASTLNIGNGTGGFRNVVWANSNAANTLSGINTALSNLAISNVAVGNQTFNFGNNALSGTADVLNLSLQNVNPVITGPAVGSINLNSAAGLSNYETVNVVSSGNGNVVNIAQIGNGLSTLNVTGSAPFTTVNASTNLTTFNAGTATGAITYTAVTGEGNASYTGGSANDAIFLAGTYTSNDTVNGGGGTADILGLNSAQLVTASAAAQTNVSNIETLAVQNQAAASAAYTTSRFTGVNQLQLLLGAAGDLTVNNAAGAFTIATLADLAGSTPTLTAVAAGTATTDSIVLSLNDLDNAFEGGAVTLNGYETATISAVDATSATIGAVTLAPNIGASSTLNFSGSSPTVVVAGAITASVVNASGLTTAGLDNRASGAIQVNGAAGANITGSNQGDFLGGSTSADVINSGLGNDVVNGNGGGDVITLGGGLDTVQISTLGTTGALNAQASSATVLDFVTGSATTNTDNFGLQVSALNTALTGSGSAQTLAAASGAALVGGTTTTNVQSFLSNVASTAPSATNIIKITGGTNTVASNSAAQGFAAAIGAGTVALGGSFATSDQILVTYYDSANGQAVLGSVASTNTTIDSGDTFTLLARATISATDFANLGNIQFGLI